jgi:glycosyltransferase involved in cell wall biosynthesis
MSRLPLRVGLVADLTEERWPSMDLVAEMFYEQLRAPRYAGMFQIELLRPTFADRGRGIGRYLNRFWDYSRWLRRRAGDFDLFHIIDHSYAHLVHVLPAERTIVTCHDVDAFMPLVDATVIPTRLPRAITRAVLSGMRKAACITCVSTATQRDVESFGLADPDRLVVVPNGVHPSMSAAPDADVDTELRHMLGRKDDAAVELLHVGSCIPRKRIDLLLQIVAAVSKIVPHVRLLKAGGQLTDEQKTQACHLGIANQIVQLSHLPPELLAALYRRADMVLVTSSREGFGLPVVEALATGTPVVATDIPVLREVGGTAVTYAPLGAIDGWRDAVLAQVAAAAGAGAGAAGSGIDTAERQVLRQRRICQASRFSWTSAAAQLAGVYEQVAVRGGRI